MAVVRIITGDPQTAAEASDYLRSRGHSVQMAWPGQASSSRADLELDLRDMSSEQALQRAKAALEAAPAEAPAAAAAIERRAIAYDITGRPVEFASEEDPSPSGGPKKSRWASLRLGVRGMAEAALIPISHLREWVSEARNAAAERKRSREEQRAEQERLLHEAGRRKQEEIAAELRRKEEAGRVAADEERERVRLAAERDMQARAERERVAQLRAEAQRAADEQERQRQEALAERERRQRQAEEARLAAQREVEQRRQELQQAAMAAAREQRQREEAARGLMEQFRREARLEASRERFQVEQERAGEAVRPAEDVLAHRRPHVVPRIRSSQRDTDWKKAAVAAGIIALLATLGFAGYASRKPAAPLSNSDLVRSRSITQPVPFGSATIAPGAQPSPTQPQLPQHSVAPPASPARAQAPAPSPRKRTLRHRRSSQADSVADDEVVVHHRGSGTAAAAPSTSARSTTGPKRFSDLDQ